MAAISSNLVLTLVTTYLLLLILFAVLILRYISLRRARTTYRPFSLRGISGFLIWASGFLTLIYAILGTWWWIAAEKYALAYLNSISDIHFSSIPPSAGGSDPSAAAAKTVDRLFDPPRKELETRLGAETGLSMLYIFIMWAVKAVFLLLIREAWGKIGKATKVVWWISAVNAGLCWFVLVVGTVTVIGVNLTKGSIHEALEFMTEAMVLNIGLAHIQSLVLVLLTCSLALRELSPYFPLAIPPRHTAILFAFAVLSILFTSLRLAAASSPYPRESFIHILTIGELFLLVSITALPSTALARASSLHGNLLRIPSPTDPGYTHHHHRNSHSPSRNHKNLRVSTHETKVTASDFGYTVTVMGQGDNGQPIPSAPLFVPEKVQLRPGWDEKVDFGAAGYVSSSEEDTSSSDEELGRGKWKGGRASARVSGLRSGFEEGRDWRRSVGGDEIRTPRSARTRFGGTTPRTPRTPRGFV